MKNLSLALLLLGILQAPLQAADEALAAVQRANAARVKATIAGDADALGELLSDDLVYGNNDARVETKIALLDAVRSHQVQYDLFEPSKTKLLETAPGVVTMTGLVHLKVSRNSTRVEFSVRYLAVWREENGRWRLHAYQSARLP